MSLIKKLSLGQRKPIQRDNLKGIYKSVKMCKVCHKEYGYDGAVLDTQEVYKDVCPICVRKGKERGKFK